MPLRKSVPWHALPISRSCCSPIMSAIHSTTPFPWKSCFNAWSRPFVPYIHKGPLQFKRIGIAWDGSRLAARALRDAAPFLKDAQEVAIISINEPSKPENPSAAELATHLARRGRTAKLERASADSADIQSSILSIAADTGLDLIVMGAYGTHECRNGYWAA